MGHNNRHYNLHPTIHSTIHSKGLQKIVNLEMEIVSIGFSQDKYESNFLPMATVFYGSYCPIVNIRIQI